MPLSGRSRGIGGGGAPLRGDARGGRVAAAHPVVGPSDQPVPAGDDESRRGEGDLAQLGVTAGVLAPQTADDVDGLLGGRGEFQARVDGCARVEPEVLRAEAPPEAAGEHLGDEGRGGAPGLLPAQPPGDRCLVISQIKSVFEAELVHATGETCVGEPRFCDERGELSVGSALRGSIRHLRCGLLPSGYHWVPGLPVSSPYGLVNGANVAESKRPIAHFDVHSSDRVRIDRWADECGPDVQWRGRVTYLTKGSFAYRTTGPSVAVPKVLRLLGRRLP